LLEVADSCWRGETDGSAEVVYTTAAALVEIGRRGPRSYSKCNGLGHPAL